MKCGTCHFGVEIGGGLQCHRFPPQFVSGPGHPDYPHVMNVEERWPWVDPANHWCGEHKEKQS